MALFRIWDQPVTVKEMLKIAVGMVIGVVVLIFVVAGLTSQGQKELARRVDLNAQLTRLLVSEHNYEQRCILQTVPKFRTLQDHLDCIERADETYAPLINSVIQKLRDMGEPVPQFQEFEKLNGNNNRMLEGGE